MRAHPAAYDLVSPGNLASVLALLASDPGKWLPVAGGTEVMVLYSAGKLPQHNLVNLWNLPELRRVHVQEDAVTIGGGCTFTQIRSHPVIGADFPLLALAAAWVGGIANQNRATLAGNLANASPAADSPPALLAYEAEIELISARGSRRLPYADFHLAYKRTALLPDELIYAVHLPRKFAGWRGYARKVGARNAQAVSKVCIAAQAKIANRRIQAIRIGMGSIAPVPLQLSEVGKLLIGCHVDRLPFAESRKSLNAAIAPIDDIRSTMEYRRHVAGNLLEEFLRTLSRAAAMNPVLASWNAMRSDEAAAAVLPCCGSRCWAAKLANSRPFAEEADLLRSAEEIWWRLDEADWLEAFATHPRIGERRAPKNASGQSAAWSAAEQRSVMAEDDSVLAALAEGNHRYEERFGRVFLVCAAGKTAREMLETLQNRLANDEKTELREAAQQQLEITALRLKRWLNQ